MADTAGIQMVVFERWTLRDHEHESRAFQPVHDETQRLEGHSIGPVQVLDDNQIVATAPSAVQ